MDRRAWLRGARRYLPPALVLLCVAAFYGFCVGRVQTRFPELRPRDGVLDAREADFAANVYHLVNAWDYYPGQILFPDAFADLAAAPAKDNDAPLDANKGTWRLRLLATPDTYLTLCAFSIDYSTRIFVNGTEVRNVGFVSDDPARAVPRVRYVTLPLYFDGTGEVELIYQYANYVHNDGGFIQNTLISTPENIDEYRQGLTLNAMVLSGGLVMLAFYFLLCAAFQRNREYAALALCCLVIALRNQFFFAQHLLPAAISFYVEYRLVVLDVSWIPMTTVFLLTAFFSRAADRKPLLGFSALCLVLSALHFIVDTHDLVLLCHVCYYAALPFALWFLIKLFRSFKGHWPGAADAVTLAAILFFTAMLVREGMATGSDSSVNHFGITPLAMVVCILLLAIVNNEKISRQMAQLREARQRNALLLQLNATNNDFLRTVAHELKTPVASIRGYMETLLENPDLDEATRNQFIARSHRQTERLASLLSDIATLSRMDFAPANHPHEVVDLTQLVCDMVLELSLQLEEHRQTFQNLLPDDITIEGDPSLFYSIFRNLTDNAMAYAGDKAVITLTASMEGPYWHFTFYDNGPGVDQKHLKRLFERFYRVESGRSRAQGGTGLGLAIVKNAVALHGGTIHVMNRPGGGLQFDFTLPVMKNNG